MSGQTAFIALCFVLGSTEVALGKYVRNEGNASQNSEEKNEANATLPWVDRLSMPQGHQPSHTRPVSPSKDGVLRSSPEKLPSAEFKESSRHIARLSKTKHAESSRTDAHGTAGTESDDEDSDDQAPTEETDLDSPESTEIDAGSKGEHVLDDETPEDSRSADAPIRRKEVVPQADDDPIKSGAGGENADASTNEPEDSSGDDDQLAMQEQKARKVKKSQNPTKVSELVRMHGDELPPWEDKKNDEPDQELPFSTRTNEDASKITPNSSDLIGRAQPRPQAKQPEMEWLDKYLPQDAIQSLEALHEDPDPRSLHSHKFASRLAQRFYSKDIRDIKVNSHGVVLAESTKEQDELRASREDSKSGLAAIFSPSFGKRTKTLAEAKARGQKQK